MEPLVLSVRLRGHATQPSGEPPEVDVRADSESITVERGTPPTSGLESVSYETHVTFTGETSFVESGRMALGLGGDAVRFSTVRDGFMGPSPDPSLLQGAVLWKIDGGEGRFGGASGLITSNFLLNPETGDVSEHQIATIFLGE